MGQLKSFVDYIEKTDLSNISNKMFYYLTKTSRKELINIKKTFEFDGFKEMVRSDLVLFSSIYDSFLNEEDMRIQRIVYNKSELRNQLGEILSNEELLNNFTTYKIQQFINDLVSEVCPAPYYDKTSYATEHDKLSIKASEGKYLLYGEREFDLSDFYGYATADEISSFLYSEFGYENLKLRDYTDTLKFKLIASSARNRDYYDELNKYLFEAGVDVVDNKSYIYSHPLVSNNKIFSYIKDGAVAKKKTKKKLGLKVCGKEY